MEARPEVLAALASRASAAAAGSGSALVLTGELGIGRSTTLDRAAAEADRQGLRVLRVEGLRAEEGLPFGALQRLLPRDLIDAALAPALQHALNPEGPASAGDQFAPGWGLHACLAAAAATTPLAIVVDDVQWLDQASARALGVVARRVEAIPVLVLLARRDGEGTPVPEGIEVHALERLDRAASRSILIGQGIVEDAVQAELLVQGDGNPLALTVLARRLAGAAPGGSAIAAVPAFTASTADPASDPVLRARAFAPEVAALTEATRIALAAAGAAGVITMAEFDDVLARLDLTRTDLAPAVEAGLLHDRLPATTAFRHPLVRQEAWEQVGPFVRRRIHQAVGDVARDPDRATWHRAFAAEGPDADVADALEAAGHRATVRGAPAVASRAYATAAALSPDPDTGTRRSLVAAEAALRAGQPDEARRLVAGLRPTTPQGRARAARIRIRATRRPDTPLQDELTAAADAVAAIDPALAAELYCDLAIGAVADLDARRASALARHACELTQGLPGPHADRASVLLGLGHLLSGRTAEADALVRRWEGAFENTDHLGPLLDAVSTALRWQTAFDEGRALATSVMTRARAEGRTADLARALTHLASIQVLQCDLDDADRNAAEAMALTAMTEQTSLGAAATLSRAAVAIIQGDRDRAEGFFAQVEALGPTAPSLVGLNVTAWRAEMALDDARPEEALAILEPVQAVPGPAAALWLGDSIEALVALGRRDEAAHLLAEVGPGLRSSGHRRSMAMVARSEGLLAGDRPTVDRCFSEALELVRDPSQPHPWIKAQLGWASRLAYLGDPQAALDHAHAAASACRRVGAVGLARRVDQLLGSLDRSSDASAAPRPATAAGGSSDPAEAPAETEGAGPARLTTVRVQLLGRFEVLVDGEPRAMAQKPAATVQLLAVDPAGRHVDEVAEALWPDAGPGVGRRRLRNVLTRIRDVEPSLVTRTGDVLSLSPHVVVDARRFETDAHAALTATDPQTRADLLRAALAAYRHPLLPGARYDPWATAPRERLRMLALDLVEQAVDQLEASGSERAVVELCLLAEELEPLDERWPLRAARAELAAGHTGAAGRAVDRARAVFADLDIPASADLLALEAEITRRGPPGEG